MCKASKTLYKYQIADLIGISTPTLRRWINGRYLSQLKEVGYSPNQKYLTAPQINKLNQILDFLD